MKYVIYARKSTESEDRQALSIQSQIIEMQEIAKRENIKVVDILQESKSAKQPGRPIFNEMIEKFQKGKYDGVLCWKIDRLARNPMDEGIVKWLLQNGIIKQIKTFDRDYNPDDNVVIASIEFSMANQYIRDLSKNVKRGLAEKVRRGEFPSNPPIGYLTDYKTRKIIIDEEKWQHVKDAFSLYATGYYSIQKLARKLTEDGLRSRHGRQVHTSALHRLLTNPFYFGWFRWKGQLHKGVHPTIISKNLFDEVQKILYPRKHMKRESKRQYTFRGLMTCGECGLKITAETQKGHNYYRCTKSKGVDKCSQKYLREEELIKEIDRHLAKLHINEELLNLFSNLAKELSHRSWSDNRELEKKNQILLDKNKFLQDSLVGKFISNAVPEEIYNRKLAELRNEEAMIEDKLKSIKENNHNVFEKIDIAARFAKFAKGLFEDGQDDIKKEVVSIITSNIRIKDKKIEEFALAEPFNYLMVDVEKAKKEKALKEVFEPSDYVLDKTKTANEKVAVSSMYRVWDSNP